MKRLLLSLSLICFGYVSVFAQFDEVKNHLMLGQAQKAKELLVPIMNKPKQAAKPEAQILNAAINAALAQATEDQNQKMALLNESIAQYQKYMEVDPKMEFIGNPTYINAPIIYYSTYFNKGITSYNAKNYEQAAQDFENTVKWSEFLINNKLAQMEFDTSANLLAGASYQNAQKEDEAVKYFLKLAEKKIGGEDNEFLYQFLMNYYFRKNDQAKFNQFRTLGAELYPSSEFFTYKPIDFVLAMEDNVEKTKRLEQLVKDNPDDKELQENYGYILFDMLNDRKKDASKLPGYDDTEAKMVAALKAAGEANANDGKAWYYLGNHYINKGVKINDQLDEVAEKIREFNRGQKADPKTGKMPAPPQELIDSRNQLRAAYDVEIENALPFLVNAAEGYAKHGSLTGIELQNYKRVVDQLIIIYGDKRTAAKAAADKAKFDAQEKKWKDVYSKL